MRRKKHVTFEGGDGAGKTTQIELLKAALEKEGRSVVVTREPGGNAVAEKIRELLLDRASVMEDMTEAYLYAAARAEHVRAVILPALAVGCGVALMACLLLKAKMKSVRQGAEADVYVTAEGLDLTVRSDVYTHTTEVRRRKSNKDGAESGGGGSGRSGHY